MIKVLFICWGNICRSPAAEFIFSDLARQRGESGRYFAASAGVSDEEEGNGVYPPMRRLLADRGIDCAGKTARKIRREDYDAFDLLVCMDEVTIGRTRRFFGGDPAGKVRNLLDYAGRTGEEIDDPWYTRDFDTAMREITEGCEAMLTALSGELTLDLSACRDKAEIYAVLRREMEWQDWYGSNLDALWDVLTGLEHRGERFRLILPPPDAEIAPYANLVRETFREAGKLAEEEE